MKIFLHIGLHKTATTFFQYHVFAHFRSEEILYNPPDLMESLHEIFTSPRGSGERLDSLVAGSRAILDKLENAGTRKLFLSEEDFSQRFIEFNFEQNEAILKRIFPHAHVIIFFRYQPDWLLSAYKQKVKHIPDLRIRDFLGYREGRFEPPKGGAQVDALGLDYSQILKTYLRDFGKARVDVFFYEDFLQNNRVITDRLCALLGAKNRAQHYWKVYKGDSALVIVLRIFARRLFKAIPGRSGINRREDKNRALPSLQAARRDLSLPRFVSVVARKAFHLLGARIKASSWLDWDLLRAGGMRAMLDAHYRSLNGAMREHFEDGKIPGKYLDRQPHASDYAQAGSGRHADAPPYLESPGR